VGDGRDDRRDELVQLVGENGAGAAYEPVPRRPRPGRADALSTRWLRVGPLDRALILVSVAVLAATVLIGVHAAQERRPVRHLTHSVVVHNRVPGVDALGCPVIATCFVRPATTLRRVVHARMPTLSVTYADEVVERRTSHVYRRELLGHEPGDALSVVRIIAACVPGGTGNTSPLDAVSQSYAGPPAGGLGAPLRIRMTPVVDGCFAYVSYQATPGATAIGHREPASRLLALVTDPALTVHP
jgi:hypothetical protein